MIIKRRIPLLAILALLLILSGSAGLASAQDNGPQLPGQELPAHEFAPGEVLVQFEQGFASAQAEGLMQQLGASFVETIYGSDIQVWRVPEGQEKAAAERLNGEAGVAFAEPNYVASILVDPDDPNLWKQWGHTKINSLSAWDISTGATNLVIAVIDTGIDETHPDLASKIVPGYDFYDDDSTPHDTNGHGTHVAGIAAAITNNTIGVAGMNWGARIMPIRVLGTNGNGYNADILAGINWAYQHGADVLNLSLGGTTYDPLMQLAVTAAHDAGALVVAAMGNNRTNGNPIMYPAAYSNVFAVAATAPDDTYSYFSQSGAHCDIAAPGGEMMSLGDPDGIYSTMPTYTVYFNTEYGYLKNYDYLHGTSQATPYVSGLAALIWSVAPTLSPDDVQGIIEDTAVDLGDPGWDVNYGHGRINALAALQSAQSDGIPAAPVLAAISNDDGNGDFLLDWNDVDNATSYTLQRANNIYFAESKTIYTGAASQYAATNTPGGTWYFRVRAENAQGKSPWSNTRSITVIPAAPTLNAISNPASLDEYLLSWSSSVGANSYLLQEASDAAFSNPVTRYLGDALQYNVTGQDGGAWYYRVQAKNSGGASSWSSPVQSTSVITPALAAPTLSSINNPTSDNSFTLAWSAVLSATTYTVEQSDSPYFENPTEVYSGAQTQFVNVNDTGGEWFYRVRAFGPAGSGPWSNTESTEVIGHVYVPLIVSQFWGEEDGFASEFTNSAVGWTAHSGFWTVSDGSFSTVGILDSSASASYSIPYTNFDIQARLWRSGCSSCSNRLIVRGRPLPLDSTNHWNQEYVFQYSRDGYFSVTKRSGGSGIMLQDWTYSLAIQTGSTWNTLRVVAVGPTFKFYINGALVWSGSDATFSSGQVGVGMYRANTTDDLFRVDWVRLVTAQSTQAEVVSAEQQLLNDAAISTGEFDFHLP